MDFVELFLEKGGQKPLYAQLYEYLAQELRAGRIPAGEKLPGKRSAAAQLGVSVNTVDEAYQLLAAEGYITARPRSGFIANNLGLAIPPAPPPSAPAIKEHAPSPIRYSFLSGGIDTSLFPHKTWNRLSREVFSSSQDLFSSGDAQGEEILRGAIADYLRGFRGVHCNAEQIVVGAGLEVLMGRLAPLLPEGPTALENPGYPETAKIFQNAGRAITAIDLDEQGLRPELLSASLARSVYLTPSHQFPSGGTMPAPRRAALLRWAAGSGGVIIEDDYDSEFRFDGRPIPSLQGMDKHGCVVYAGTFSRSLAPGIRAAYLVLPPPLLALWRQHYGSYACTLWRADQHTLALFLQRGHFARRLNRMRATYRLRRDMVLQQLATRLAPEQYEALNTHTGLYFCLRLPGVNAKKLTQKALQEGIALAALSSYAQPVGRGFSLWHGGRDILVLGYGGLPAGAEAPALEALTSLLAAARTP